MWNYDNAVKAAIKLTKKSEDVTFSAITGYDFPKSNKEYADVEKAILDVKHATFILAQEAHPLHSRAVLMGESNSECFKIWMNEGGSSYLKKLTQNYVKKASLVW